MEHLNNDMDDLFSKAGELYPLRTTESDWEGVLGKLREEISRDQQVEPGLNARLNRSKRRWLFLLLLLPIGLFSIVYFSKSKILPAGSPNSATVHQNRESENSPAKNRNASQANPPAENRRTVGTPPNQEANLNRSGGIQSNSGSFPEKTETMSAASHKPIYSSQRSGETGNNSVVTDNGTAVTGKENLPSSSGQAFANADGESFHSLMMKTLSLSVVNSSEMVSVRGKPFPAPVGISLKTEPGEPSVKSKTDMMPGSKGIFIGLLAGPDISSVDFQSIKHPGFSLGVLIGYRFNKRLALETGLLWDKKYYYSTGQYFNKSKTTIPSNVNIINVDGNCNMFEIPLALRYDFVSRENHGYFVKAGLSSYLMKKENYSYLAETYGMQYQHDATYLNSTNNIFSILQLSGGYEHTLSGNTKIRIEPYLKIPIQGIGIGSMPISSAGIYIGISHYFH